MAAYCSPDSDCWSQLYWTDTWITGLLCHVIMNVYEGVTYIRDCVLELELETALEFVQWSESEACLEEMMLNTISHSLKSRKSRIMWWRSRCTSRRVTAPVSIVSLSIPYHISGRFDRNTTNRWFLWFSASHNHNTPWSVQIMGWQLDIRAAVARHNSISLFS